MGASEFLALDYFIYNMKVKLEDIEPEDDYGKVCCRCWNSVCDPCDEECEDHPFDGKERWCHKYGKPVFNLEDATNCPGFDDD